MNEIPREVREAAELLSCWFHNETHWQLMSVCSRNHAYIAQELAECLKKYQARYHEAPHAKKDYQKTKEVLDRFKAFHSAPQTSAPPYPHEHP